MKRISGGQLSLGANATLLSSHAGGPRAAAGDTSFAGQAKQSTEQSRVSPPPAREPTGQVGRHRPNPKDDDSERSLGRLTRERNGRRIALVGPLPRLVPAFHGSERLSQRRAQSLPGRASSVTGGEASAPASPGEHACPAHRRCNSIEGSRSGAAHDPALALPFPGSTMEHPGAASGESVPSARDACALIPRPRRSMGVDVALRGAHYRSVREHVASVVLPSRC